MPAAKTGKEAEVSLALEKVTDSRSSTAALTSVTLTCRKISHLRQNVEALTIRLTSKESEVIDSAYPFDVGFPMISLEE
ncbi:hypothetical protein A1O7_04679 [Cladophialophora yegresii CBS 114405]|uniref:Uncharacterized protein n=1 Tax=Cladophialophora yegresii CBS 114405 TaxID=1182544 RepID=W9W7M0_9EURO|nr:uncharacterized protein A1O7_04679 [Cladophialophora yegresii CBS 114405]EXJ60526.1 hypothetical protein A1O7_04679 [Cladophialophora yegresii CBS 114405]